MINGFLTRIGTAGAILLLVVAVAIIGLGGGVIEHYRLTAQQTEPGAQSDSQDESQQSQSGSQGESQQSQSGSEGESQQSQTGSQGESQQGEQGTQGESDATGGQSGTQGQSQEGDNANVASPAHTAQPTK